jgi:hypothetical protein
MTTIDLLWWMLPIGCPLLIWIGLGRKRPVAVLSGVAYVVFSAVVVLLASMSGACEINCERLSDGQFALVFLVLLGTPLVPYFAFQRIPGLARALMLGALVGQLTVLY